MASAGPPHPYALLFDDDTGPGPGLPEAVRATYGGDWRLPPPHPQRPHTYTNFVVSHDGRISFNEPGRSGSHLISLRSPHDTWLMGLLRARADAILVGGATLRLAPHHAWTPAGIFPADAAAFAELRRTEGRPEHPTLVILTLAGDLPADARALAVPGQPVLVATTPAGAERALAALGPRPGLAYHTSPGPALDMAALMAELRHRWAVGSLLSEAGGRIYGELLRAGLIDEAFLTHSPVIAGNPPPPAPPRVGLVEGVGFPPLAPPRAIPVSLRRAGPFLFSRSRIVRP